MKNIKSIILKRNNTIEDPEFKQALSDLNPDVIYEKLKVICKRNPKEKFLNSDYLTRPSVQILHSDWLVSELLTAPSKMAISQSDRVTG